MNLNTTLGTIKIKIKSVVNTENMYDFSQRFESALLDIANRHKNETGNILAVGHSSMAFYLQKYRQDKPLSGLSNTAVRY